MKLPRDIAGTELAALLRRYGYEVTRQTGNHIRLTSKLKGHEHHLTVPRHTPLKIGTLSGVLADVAAYLEKDRRTVIQELFE